VDYRTSKDRGDDMSTVNVSLMSPRVREAFLHSRPALLAWDMRAHEILKDSVINHYRVHEPFDRKEVRNEKRGALLLAVIADAAPVAYLYYSSKHQSPDHDLMWISVCLFAVATSLIFFRCVRRVRRVYLRGAEWQTSINKLIQLVEELSAEEQQELYAAMYVLGMEIRASRVSAANAYNNGYWDGFTMGGD